MSPEKLLIETRGVALRQGSEIVLEGVDFAIRAGEIVTVVGPNGSGKSSLMRALIGALKPTKGEIIRAEGLRIGYVPQRLEVGRAMPMTVRRFLDLPRRVSNDRASQALENAGVEALGRRQMTELSGGQFQRVLLARALLSDPQLLVLDEATRGLDQPGSAEFYRQIEAVRDATGCAVLMVSHDLHVVMAASDRVVCLNGHICCEGTPAVVSVAPAYQELFGSGTGGALALYRHLHDHDHNHDHSHSHGHQS